MNCFSISIHAPGRGSIRAHAGCKLSNTYGAASPRRQRGEDREGNTGGLRQREADRRAHQRSSAWRRHHRGQHTGKEAAGIPLLLRQLAAD